MVTEKIVLDTNVLISAFGWKGNEHRLLRGVIEGEFQLCLSEQQIDEIKRVLSYKKLGFPSYLQEEFLLFLRSIAKIVDILDELDIIQEDPSDNIILETAVMSGARIIISGDKHLLQVREYKNIRVLTAKEFLSLKK